MLCSFHRMLIVFVCLFSFATAHAQETRVVVVPLGGDDIGQCELSTLCINDLASLTCPSGITMVPCEAPKKVFVTSTQYKGDLGGVAGADIICQSHAASANPPLSGTYKAWLSAGFTGPSRRFDPTSGGYVRAVSGFPLYASQDALFSSSGVNIIRDENGEAVDTGESVWTNTNWNGDGIEDGAFTCQQFSSDGAGFFGIVGVEGFGGQSWTEDGYLSCAQLARLYCFEQ